MEIIIDYREHKLKNHFENSDDYSKYLKIENLKIGDIILKYNNKTVLLIERKTMDDLGSSINDGRHREQKFRLINSDIPKKNIMFLIEGEIKNLKYGYITKKTLQGSIINTIFRDNITLYRVKDIDETIYFLERLINKILSDKGKCIKYLLQDENKDKNIKENNNEKSENEYLKTKKMAKKDCLTPSSFNKLILLQIPGISNKIMEVIFDNYKSIKDILYKYKEIEDDYIKENNIIENILDEKTNNIDIIKKKKLLFSDLLLETNSGKKRKIGKVLSTRIYEFLNYSNTTI